MTGDTAEIRDEREGKEAEGVEPECGAIGTPLGVPALEGATEATAARTGVEGVSMDIGCTPLCSAEATGAASTATSCIGSSASSVTAADTPSGTAAESKGFDVGAIDFGTLTPAGRAQGQHSCSQRR
jgi:hypothetical protein